jgi:hypothetical protein
LAKKKLMGGWNVSIYVVVYTVLLLWTLNVLA